MKYGDRVKIKNYPFFNDRTGRIIDFKEVDHEHPDAARLLKYYEIHLTDEPTDKAVWFSELCLEELE